MKKIIKYPIIFIITNIILIGLFCCSSMISKESIRDNVNESIEQMDGKENSVPMIGNIKATKQDVYADRILLNIAVSQNEKNPLNSIMNSKYYDDYFVGDNEDISKITNKDLDANQEYLRYWHGSIMIVKPLLVFFNLNQIYVFNYIVLGILLLSLLIILYKKDKLLSLITLISFILTYSFLVPNTLEYTWVYYIAIITSIVLILDKNKFTLPILFISGICTCFFDFLTTETLTLLLPLTLLIILNYKDNKNINFKDTLLFIFKCCLVWGIGYCLMWLSKWILSSLILNVNSFNLVFDRAKFRVDGVVADSLFEQIVVGLFDNCSNLLVFSIFGKFKNIIFVIFTLLVGSVFFLFRKSKKKLIFSKVLFAIGLIPIVRFLVMSNHSYVHSFFTYRALLPTIICFIYAFIYGIDKKLIKK